MSDKRDYYEILGVPRNADKDTIKKAYRKLAMKYHPDRNTSDKDAEAKFKEASEAAEVLLHDEKRTRYDQFGHAGVGGQPGGFGGGFGGFGGDGFADLGDIFGDIFGDILGGGRRRGSTRSNARAGNDLQAVVRINFMEAAFGVEKEVSINRFVTCSACDGTGGESGSKPITCPQCHGYGEIRRQQGFFTMATTCPQCHGTGQVISNPCSKCHGDGRVKKKVNLEVKIPAGIDSGQRLKLAREGDGGIAGGPPGNLYVVIEVEAHEFFERDGFDVFCTIPISFSQAALGTELEVPTINGRVALKVPAGVQSGKKMRLKGKGIPKLGAYGNGDQIVELHVETPTRLCAEQKELLKKLAQYETESNPMGRSFFERMKDLF